MSTSLNDVVFEVYREVMKQAEVRNMTKLQKFFKAPQKLFKWLKWHIKAPMYSYGRKIFFGGDNVYAAGTNIFHPTKEQFPDVKIAVYYVITGNYDSFRMPIYIDDTIDYYLFTDSGAGTDTQELNNFRIMRVPESLDGLNNVRRQRYTKLHPDEVLSESVTGKKYDYTVYIDGSMRITCDIKPLVYSLIVSGKSFGIHKHFSRDCLYDEAELLMIGSSISSKDIREQTDFYSREGMPRHFGLPETTVLIRRCNDPQLQDIMQQWWLQIERFTHRDQISLPYVLWKNGLDMSYLFSLGNNVWQNPYFLYHAHNSH